MTKDTMKKLSEINKRINVNEGMSENPDMKLSAPLVEGLDPQIKKCLVDVLKLNNKTHTAITEGNGTCNSYSEREYVKDFESFIQENKK